MKTHTKLFIASSVHKIFAILFCLLGAYLHDKHRPPYDEFGESCYYIAAGLGLTAMVLGIVGLNWQVSADRERRHGVQYDKQRY